MATANMQVIGRKFTGSFAYANVAATLPISIDDIARSALLCGHMPLGWFSPFPKYRGHSARWRTSLIRAYLAVNTSTNSVVPTDAFDMLESTEQAFVTWMIGSALTHWAAQNRLQIPIVLHLRQYGLAFDVTFRSRERPDFIAPYGPKDWAVIEAKGRRKVSAALFMSAKGQTEAIDTVDGVAPTLRVVSVAAIHRAGLHVELEDPPAEPIQLAADVREVVTEYYATVNELLERDVERVAIRGEGFDVADVPGLDLRIGLSTSRRGLLSDLQSEEVLATVLRPHRSVAGDDPEGKTSVGPDGVVVLLGDSWAGSLVE